MPSSPGDGQGKSLTTTKFTSPEIESRSHRYRHMRVHAHTQHMELLHNCMYTKFSVVSEYTCAH